MIITNVKIRKLFDKAGPLKAIVSVTFDDQLALHDVKIINSNDTLFIVMPSRRDTKDTFCDVAHPINSEFRKTLEDAILKAYDEAVELREQRKLAKANKAEANTDAE